MHLNPYEIFQTISALWRENFEENWEHMSLIFRQRLPRPRTNTSVSSKHCISGILRIIVFFVFIKGENDSKLGIQQSMECYPKNRIVLIPHYMIRKTLQIVNYSMFLRYLFSKYKKGAHWKSLIHTNLIIIYWINHITKLNILWGILMAHIMVFCKECYLEAITF